MKRVISFEISLTNTQKFILDSLMKATSKLWNVGNYERRNWKKESGVPYPDWYQQKKALKEHFWYKALPSQSAQEVLKQLHEAWKSFYVVQKKKSIENPEPPRFKKQPFNIRFLNKGFQIEGNRLRLSLPKQLKQHLQDTHDIHVNYLYVNIPQSYRNSLHNLKMIEIIPLGHKYKVNMIVELCKDPAIAMPKKDVYMSIDLGVNNLLTCYVSTGESVIFSGRQLLSINRYFDKMIAHYQGIADADQSSTGVRYPKKTRRVKQLYRKRGKQVAHLIHTVTRNVVRLATQKHVTKVILGDISGIREEKNLGRVNNQKFHRLPYLLIEKQLRYKLEEHGIELVKQEESYTSQCSPYSPEVSKIYADQHNRKQRGLYVFENKVYNADCVGAYNILRKYLRGIGKPYPAVVALDTPVMYRWNQYDFIANTKLANSLAM